MQSINVVLIVGYLEYFSTSLLVGYFLALQLRYAQAEPIDLKVKRVTVAFIHHIGYDVACTLTLC